MLEAAAAAVGAVKEEDVAFVRRAAHEAHLLRHDLADVVSQAGRVVVVPRVDHDLIGRLLVLERDDLEIRARLDRRIDQRVVVGRGEHARARLVEAGRERPARRRVDGDRECAGRRIRRSADEIHQRARADDRRVGVVDGRRPHVDVVADAHRGRRRLDPPDARVDHRRRRAAPGSVLRRERLHVLRGPVQVIGTRRPGRHRDVHARALGAADVHHDVKQAGRGLGDRDGVGHGLRPCRHGRDEQQHAKHEICACAGCYPISRCMKTHNLLALGLVATARASTARLRTGRFRSASARPLANLDAAKAAGFDYVELGTSEIAGLSDADFDEAAGANPRRPASPCRRRTCSCRPRSR